MQEPISKLQEEEHQQELLKESAFLEWLDNNAIYVFKKLLRKPQALCKEIYLKEHGLPLDSVFTD